MVQFQNIFLKMKIVLVFEIFLCTCTFCCKKNVLNLFQNSNGELNVK